jgi:hypothetical protein
MLRGKVVVDEARGALVWRGRDGYFPGPPQGRGDGGVDLRKPRGISQPLFQPLPPSLLLHLQFGKPGRAGFLFRDGVDGLEGRCQVGCEDRLEVQAYGVGGDSGDEPVPRKPVGESLDGLAEELDCGQCDMPGEHTGYELMDPAFRLEARSIPGPPRKPEDPAVCREEDVELET